MQVIFVLTILFPRKTFTEDYCCTRNVSLWLCLGAPEYTVKSPRALMQRSDLFQTQVCFHTAFH